MPIQRPRMARPGAFPKSPLSATGGRAPVSRFSAVRAICLDMDNTIIDFAGSRKAALEAVLDKVRAAGHEVDRKAFLARHRALTDAEDQAYLLTGAWRPTVERFATLCREFGMPADGFAHAVTEFYGETRYAHLHPYPETHAALAALQARFPLFLITNGPAGPQHREIEVTGVAPYFVKTFVCEDHGMRKPDPRMFELVRKAAGVPDGSMMMVGDFWEADIETPRKLGWATAWVVREDARRKAADPGRADAVVRSVAELPPLLGLGAPSS
jgi:HAD superfamily hydrolase (TIGR01549 family)